MTGHGEEAKKTGIRKKREEQKSNKEFVRRARNNRAVVS